MKYSFRFWAITSATFLVMAGCTSSSVPSNSTSTPAATPTAEVTLPTTSPPAVAPTFEASSQAATSAMVTYQGVDGVNAIELLRKNHQIQTKDFGKDVGEFVESIDGKVPAKDEFWAFYINGASASVGPSLYITKNTDTLQWKLDKIDNSAM